MFHYKRIINVAPSMVQEMLTHACFGVNIRPAKNSVGDWVIETNDRLEINRVNKIVEIFDTGI